MGATLAWAELGPIHPYQQRAPQGPGGEVRRVETHLSLSTRDELLRETCEGPKGPGPCSFLPHDRGRGCVQQTTERELFSFLHPPCAAAGFCLLKFMACLGFKSVGMKEIWGGGFILINSNGGKPVY